MKAMPERIVVGAVLAIFLGSLFFSLYHVASGMAMEGSMVDCPYMSHEAVLCPMNLLDHITAWKAVFTLVVPSLFVFAGLLLTMVVAVSVAPNVLRKIKLWLLRIPINRYRFHTKSFIVRALQELFSSGILHPKLF